MLNESNFQKTIKNKTDINCQKCGDCCRPSRVHLRDKDAINKANPDLLHKVVCEDGDIIYKVKLRNPDGELMSWESVYDTPDNAICGALDKDNMCELHTSGKPNICRDYHCQKCIKITPDNYSKKSQ